MWQPASRPSCSSGSVTWPLTSAPAKLRALLARPSAACLAPRALALGPGAASGLPLPRPPASPASTPLREAACAASGCFILCAQLPDLRFLSLA